MKRNNFKLKDFQISEELEAILRKEHRWRVWLVWIYEAIFSRVRCMSKGKAR